MNEKLMEFFQIDKKGIITFLKPSWKKAFIFSVIFIINALIILLAFAYGPEIILIGFILNFPVMIITPPISWFVSFPTAGHIPNAIMLLLSIAIFYIPYWWLLSCLFSLKINKKSILLFSIITIPLFVMQWYLALIIAIPWLVFNAIFFIWGLLSHRVRKIVEEKGIALPHIRVGISSPYTKIKGLISKIDIFKKFSAFDRRIYWLFDHAKSKKAAILFSYLSTIGLVVIVLCLILSLFIGASDHGHGFGGGAGAAGMAIVWMIGIIIYISLILLSIGISISFPLFTLLFSVLDNRLFEHFSKTKQELTKFWAINSAVFMIVVGPLLLLPAIPMVIDVISYTLNLPWAFSSPIPGMVTLVFYIGIVNFPNITGLFVYIVFLCLVLKARTRYILKREFTKLEFIKLNLLWIFPFIAITILSIGVWLLNIAMVSMMIAEIIKKLLTSFSFEVFLYLIAILLGIPFLPLIITTIYLTLYYFVSIHAIRIIFSIKHQK